MRRNVLRYLRTGHGGAAQITQPNGSAENAQENQGESEMIKRIRNKLGKTGTVIAVLMVIAMLGATAAIAAIMLRAEITGGVDQTGAAVAFEFSDDAGVSDGITLPVNYAWDTNGDGYFDDVGTIPAPLAATATLTNGVLDIVLTGGWLPGEGVIVYGVNINNPSSVNVDVVAWDFGASDAGLVGSAAQLQIASATRVGPDNDWVPTALPTEVAAGETYDLEYLIVQIADTAEFATAYSFTGTGIVGVTTR